MKEKVPFVITEDIQTITRGMPFHVSKKMAQFASNIILEICRKYITPNVLLLKEETITKWVTMVTPKNAILQTVAYIDDLDKEKYPSIQITRANVWQEPKLVQIPRYGYPDLKTQFELMEKGDYVLLDDVIFTGEGAHELILKGRELGRNIGKVIACVSVGVGEKKLSEIGVKVESLYHFKNVIDEVCLRDFIPGLPYSGRPLVTQAGDYLYVPYLLPWGDPNSRISVPKENEIEFSIDCLNLSIEFWSEVAPELLFSNVPALIFDKQAENSMYFVDYLHQCKEILEK